MAIFSFDSLKIEGTSVTVGQSFLDSASNAVSNTVSDVVSSVESNYKTPEDISSILSEASKVDLNIALKSKDSESIEFNTLQIPDFNSEFIYNFYVSEESDLSTQEDQNLDPLLNNSIYDIPRYLIINWKPIQKNEILKSEQQLPSEQLQLKEQAFSDAKGVFSDNSTNFKESYEKNSDKINPLYIEGRPVKMADINDATRAFSSIANSVAFPNTVSVSVKPQLNNNLDLFSLVTSIKK